MYFAGEFQTTTFTDAATAYVGFGTGANGDSTVGARGTVSFFEVSVPAPECTLILLR